MITVTFQCDLERPTCENCRKRGIECVFRTISSLGLLSASSTVLEETSLSQVFALSPTPKVLIHPSYSLSPPALLDTIYQSGLVWDVPDGLQPRFKKVLHHFITTTSCTLSSSVNGQSAWATALPQIARSHPFVLDGIIAVTSLHLSRCLGFESEKVTNFNIANDRLSKGLVQYRSGLEQVTKDNANALFAFSTVITSWSLLTIGDEIKILLESIKDNASFSNPNRDNISKLVFATTQIFRCMRGVLIIIVPYWHELKDGPLGPVLTRRWWPRRVPVSPKAIEDDERLEELERIWARPENPYKFYFHTLASSLKQLRECFALVNELSIRGQRPGTTDCEEILTDWTAALVWAIHTPPEFTMLLEQRISEAWVILAHFAMLPARAKGILWLENYPTNLLYAAALVLGEANWHMIDWPIRAIGLNLDGLRLGGPEAPSSTLKGPVSTTISANTI